MNALIITNLCLAILRPESILYCTEAYKIIDRIIEVSNGFDFCFVVNDSHRESDSEFKFLPPHCLKDSVQTGRLFDVEQRIKSKHFQFLTKNKLSVLAGEHNRKIILANRFDSVCVSGFSACMDVLPTCLELLQFDQNVFIIPSCVGDILPAYKDNAVSYLATLNIVRESYGDINEDRGNGPVS